jgi:hypothetical protein
MRDLFSLLDLGYPGLEEVSAACERGDRQQAGGELLSYYAGKRRERCLDFWDMSGPEAFHPMPWGAASTNSQLWRNTPERVTAGYLDAFGHVFDFSRDENIDWGSDAGHWGEPDFPHATNRLLLNRMYWLCLLDMMYLSGPEKGRKQAALQFMRLIRSWWEQPTDFGHMSAVTAGMRLADPVNQSGLVRSWYVFLDSSDVTPEFKLRLLLDIAYQADHVVERGDWDCKTAWGMAEGVALGYAGLLLPEYKRAKAWVEKSSEATNKFLETQILPDGTSRWLDFCPSYQGGEMVIPVVFMAQAALLGHTEFLTDKSRAALARVVDWIAGVHKPDDTVPQITSSDIQGFSYWLRMAADAFARQDWLYVASSGNEGQPPDHTSKVLPYAGAFILRDGFSRDAMYACFHHGNQHNVERNSLAIDLYAFGRTLITGCGRYVYYSPEWYNYFVTAGYNTVMVDDSIQQEWGVCTPLRCGRGLKEDYWQFTEDSDFVWGIHPTGFDKAPDVRHGRGIFFRKGNYWVVVDRVTGPGEHDLSLRWLLTPGSAVAESDGLSVHTENSGANVLVLPLLPGGAELTIWEGSREPLRGWLSPEHTTMIPSPQLEYKWHAELPDLFATVIVPYTGRAPSIRAEMRAERADKVTIVICRGEAARDRLTLDFSGAGTVAFESEGKG